MLIGEQFAITVRQVGDDVPDLGVGTLIVSLLALAIYFKRRGWFGSEAAT